MASPAVSLVVLNYNGRDLLEACLPSIVAQDFDDLEVVVVDNGSADGSAELVASRWPSVRVVALPQNVGVTAALNVMVEATGGEFVGLLNNDVELVPDWTAILVDRLRARPEAAAVAGKLLQHPRRDVIDRVGDEVRWSSACFGRGSGEPDTGQYERAEEVFSVGGAAAVYRRVAFADVGLFDADFFAYVEDVDWGFRARLAGHTAWYEPSAVGFHSGGATLGGINDFSLYHLRRNQLWMVAKNYPLGSLVRHLPAVLAFNLHGLGLAARSGRFRLVAKAYFDAFRALRSVVRKRRLIQGRRRVDGRELERVIRPAGRPW